MTGAQHSVAACSADGRDSVQSGQGVLPEAMTIEPGRMGRNYWRDLWHYRELFRVLAWRNVSVRYKQTVIGIAWAVLRPVLSVVIFTLVFSRLAHLPSEGHAPYVLMVLVGLLPWQLFASALVDASNSLLDNANLIGKVYFPRMIIPAAAVASVLIEFGISLILLLAMMLWFRWLPGPQVLALPGFVLMALGASIGPGLLVAALNVKYRDIRIIVPFIVQFGLYVSPVGFTSSSITTHWRLAYALNPMVGVIDGFRWALLGQATLDPAELGISLAVTGLFLWLGVRYFRSVERGLADLI